MVQLVSYNNIRSLILAACLMSLSAYAEENAGTATISITGSITQTNSCSFQGLSIGNITMDVGDWLVSGLSENGGLMKSKDISVSVSCAKSTPFFMRFSSAATPTTDTTKMGIFNAGSSNSEMAFLRLQAVGSPQSGTSLSALSPARWSYNGNTPLSSVSSSSVGTPVSNPIVNAMNGDLKNGLIILEPSSTSVATDSAYSFDLRASMYNTRVSDWSGLLSGQQSLNATMTITFYTL